MVTIEKRREYERKYRENNRDKIRVRKAETTRARWDKDPKGMAKRQKESRAKTKKTRIDSGLCVNCALPAENGKTRCSECIEKSRAAGRNRYHKMRDDAYDAYGGRKCACCGESEPSFLTIDHIENDGSKHRKILGNGKRLDGTYLYRWLKKNNYPIGFQVLCYNCNSGKWRNGGVCPHKEKK